MIKHMNENKVEYESAMDSDHENINDYQLNYQYLDEVHLKAFHEIYHLNIMVFEYHINTDQFSQNYYYNKKYAKLSPIYLLYERHTKHYNYIQMDNNTNYKLPKKSGYFYDNHGTKYSKLQKFDLRFLQSLNQTKQIPPTQQQNDDNNYHNNHNQHVYNNAPLQQNNNHEQDCNFWSQIVTFICN